MQLFDAHGVGWAGQGRMRHYYTLDVVRTATKIGFTGIKYTEVFHQIHKRYSHHNHHQNHQNNNNDNNNNHNNNNNNSSAFL
jgi:hypothetical protein